MILEEKSGEKDKRYYRCDRGHVTESHLNSLDLYSDSTGGGEYWGNSDVGTCPKVAARTPILDFAKVSSSSKKPSSELKPEGGA